ncbi:TrkH family potassium uptake protein [bacterium]|nr:TrkH family potassium uptake protein [bacterium]
MNINLIVKVIGIFLVALALIMATHIPIGLIYSDGGIKSFIIATTITLVIGVLSYFIGKWRNDSEITHKEGFLIVALSWIIVGIFGGLPFFFQDCFGTMGFESFSSSVFESVSGFTTTGATVLKSIENQPKSILMWRSTTHWLGGMGFIVLSLTMLPFLGVSGFQLYKAEVTGPTQEKLAPRIRETALILWKLYLILTVIQIVILMILGMNFYDSINHSFATLATGGFSTKNISVESYNSAAIETVITIFMIIAGTNFSLHYYAMFKGNIKKYWRDSEFRLYIFIYLSISLWVGISLYQNGFSLEYSLRHSTFNVASIMTATGFSSVNFGAPEWGKFAQFGLMLAMFIGGSAGSTSGGIKVIRVGLIFKQATHEIYRFIFPKTANSVKFNGVRIRSTLALTVWGFIFFYFLTVIVISIIIYLTDNQTFQTSFFASLSCIGGIGPGFGGVGPAENYSIFSPTIQLLLSLEMIMGRLELYTILVLFSRHFWKE